MKIRNPKSEIRNKFEMPENLGIDDPLASHFQPFPAIRICFGFSIVGFWIFRP